jgi:hypothetical protein
MGEAVSFHEFELYLAGSLRANYLANGASSFWGINDNPIRVDELSLNSYFEQNALSSVEFARYWLSLVFGSGAKENRSKFFYLNATGLSPNSSLILNSHFWKTDSLELNGDAWIDFELPGRDLDLELCVNLADSAGALVIETDNGILLNGLDIEAVRASTFPRWHGHANIFLGNTGGCSSLRLRTIGPDALLKCSLLGARG